MTGCPATCAGQPFSVSSTHQQQTPNACYGFKHFVDDKRYETLQAGITMASMARTVLGKTISELMSR
jgi:hypothetical protein